MPNYRYFSILIYILILLLSIIICQFDNESMTKALACMSVISQKFKGSEPEPSIYSTMMLKCFITISESHARKILVGLESGQNILSKRDIEKLTDYESLRDMSQIELQKRSNELERALKKFRKIQEQFSNGEGLGDIDPSEYDDEYDDDNFDTETPSSINFFSLIPKGIAGIFNILNSYISLFLVFVIVYFGLLMIRKINDSEKKMKKKKKMMEKRMNDEFDEEEDEEYETEVYEKNKKGSKKMKRK